MLAVGVLLLVLVVAFVVTTLVDDSGREHERAPFGWPFAHLVSSTSSSLWLVPSPPRAARWRPSGRWVIRSRSAERAP